ncbi:MAG: hypothetical protein V4772_24695 [Pseudomonadota bacterium]
MQHQAAYVPTGFGANDVQIMAGTFDDFSFDDVVQVLGLSRQCLRLLIRQGEAAFSEILLKAGQVLEARMPLSSDPENVFKALFGKAVSGSDLSFAVYHTEPTGPFPVPRCRLQEVYERVKSASQPILAKSPAVSRVDLTLRLDESPVSRQASGMARAPTAQPSLTLPPDFGKELAQQLQPLLREEVASVLGQVQAQAQALHTMDGRLQALPQLIAAELRAALARHERSPVPPAPKAPAPDAAGPRGLLFAMGAGLVVLLLAVIALAVKVLR